MVCSNLYADTNKNGTYDEGVDQQAIEIPYVGARFSGCGGTELVQGNTQPHNNGFVEQGGEYYPVFFWYGNITDITAEGDLDDFHYSYLGNPDAYIDNGNAS